MGKNGKKVSLATNRTVQKKVFLNMYSQLLMAQTFIDFCCSLCYNKKGEYGVCTTPILACQSLYFFAHLWYN